MQPPAQSSRLCPPKSLLFALAVLTSCSTPPVSTPAGWPTSVTSSYRQPIVEPQGFTPAYTAALIEGIPHVRQKPDFCGEACVEMALRKQGISLDQDEVFNRSGVDPALGRGIVTAELKTVLERLGFKPGQVWYQAQASKAFTDLTTQFDALHADLSHGIPSIVCMHSHDGPGATEHFRLIVGYDPVSDDVIYNEPAEDQGAYRRMPRRLFLKLWPLHYSQSLWTVVRLRLEPDTNLLLASAKAPKTPHAPGFSRADYAQHILALRQRIGPNLTVLIEPPFVVLGDGEPQAVRLSAERTVKWAVRHLKQQYFTKDPASILDIWLFKDETSYRGNTLALFDETPETPYGYYSSKHRALIMNIATGGGTLVHEIVHPYIEANFPDCPPWLNEGLGSLYEQSGEQSGRIVGYTNWRLAGLKKAIRARKVPSFRELLSASEVTFYEEDKGTNYAQARYLCYYLQEAGLLHRFYHEFYKNRDQDPTGYDTLQTVLAEDDMDAFKQRWEAFVLGLSFP